jgi:hypothetical protein
MSNQKLARPSTWELLGPLRRFFGRNGNSVPHEPPPAVPKALDLRRGTLHEEECACLRALVGRTSSAPSPLIEIGTLFGFSTIQMAIAKAPGQKILTVDNYSWNPWGLSPEDHHLLTSRILAYLTERGHVEQLNSDKGEFFRTYRGPAPALVFLDAIHTYEQTKLDIEWCLAVKAGIVCGHDYSEEFPGVVQAVREFGGPGQLVRTLWTLKLDR